MFAYSRTTPPSVMGQLIRFEATNGREQRRTQLAVHSEHGIYMTMAGAACNQ